MASTFAARSVSRAGTPSPGMGGGAFMVSRRVAACARASIDPSGRAFLSLFPGYDGDAEPARAAGSRDGDVDQAPGPVDRRPQDAPSGAELPHRAAFLLEREEGRPRAGEADRNARLAQVLEEGTGRGDQRQATGLMEPVLQGLS